MTSDEINALIVSDRKIGSIKEKESWEIRTHMEIQDYYKRQTLKNLYIT
jgi:hypothetical protein